MSYQYYNNDNNPQNMQFYQSAYDQGGNQYPNQYGTSNQTPAVSGSMNMNTQFGGQFDVQGSMGDTALSQGILAAFSTSGYPGEPPLLEELGINFDHIKLKTLAVLNPMGRISPEIYTDSDLAGPILFCLTFGTLLLLAGKIHFGYIYGVALFGTVSLHFLFKLMANEKIDLARSASVIGYCLLPLVLISTLGVFLSLDNFFGYIVSALAVFWCTFSASGFFVAVLSLENVRPLIAYPLSIFYTTFALMVIFVEKN